MSQDRGNERLPRPGLIRYRVYWFVLGTVTLLLVWWFWPVLAQAGTRLLTIARSEAAIEALVGRLGWLGPVALILFNALQIVVAPIPAYALFGAAGFLYGGFWGGVYSTLGTLSGATAAMLLARRYGRPWVERMVGTPSLLRWDRMVAQRGLLVWGLLLLAPVGDIPYFLAGLAQVSLLRILMLTLLTRIPTIFLITTAASGSTALGWPELVVLIAGLVLIFGLMFRYQETIVGWFDARLRWQNAQRSGEVEELGD